MAAGSGGVGGSGGVDGGMGGVAGGTTTTAIQFDFDACENATALYDLTFTGTVSMDGSFDGDTNSAAEVFSAPGLGVSGALDWLDDPAIDQGCDVTFTQRGLGDDSSLSGRPTPVPARSIASSADFRVRVDPASRDGHENPKGRAR